MGFFGRGSSPVRTPSKPPPKDEQQKSASSEQKAMNRPSSLVFKKEFSGQYGSELAALVLPKSPSDIIASATLLKRRKGLGGWRSRYVVIKEPYFMYWSKPTDQTRGIAPEVAIDIRNTQRIALTNNVLSIECSHRVYDFKVAATQGNDETTNLNEWMAIITRIRGNAEVREEVSVRPKTKRPSGSLWISTTRRRSSEKREMNDWFEKEDEHVEGGFVLPTSPHSASSSRSSRKRKSRKNKKKGGRSKSVELGADIPVIDSIL